MKKDGRIVIRTSPEDAEMTERAVKNLQAKTGKKVSVAKVIRAGIAELANKVPSDLPEIYYIDRVNISKLQTNIEAGLLKLQAVLTEFEKVAGASITLDELQPLWSMKGGYLILNSDALREIVVDKLLDQQQKLYPTLQINRENIRVPDLTELMNAAEVMTYLPGINFKDQFFWHCYKVTDNKAEIVPEAFENEKDRFRAAAITVEEKRKLALVKQLCNTLNQFLDDKQLDPEKLNIKNVVMYDSLAGRYAPMEGYVKYGLSKPMIFTH